MSFNSFKKIFFIILLIICTVLIMFLLIVALIRVDTVGDIRYRLIHQGEGLISSQGLDFSLLGYAEDIGTMIDHYKSHYSEGFLFGREIARFENIPYILVFIPSEVHGPNLSFFPSRYSGIVHTVHALLLVERSDGKFYMIDRWIQGIEAFAYDTRGIWSEDARVARDIVYSYLLESRVFFDGMHLLYGSGVGEPPLSISILGYKADNIVSFEHRGNSFFFWYYHEHPHFVGMISENVDIGAPFLLSDIINLFDIRIER